MGLFNQLTSLTNPNIYKAGALLAFKPLRTGFKELSHGILSYFGHIQNYLKMVGNLKITV